MKWSLAAAFVAVALSVLLPSVTWLRSEAVIERRYPLPSTTATASDTHKAILRGAHLIAIAGCADCHGQNLEGRLMLRNGIMPVWSSNLTLLAHTSTDEELERALRTGIAPDSTSTWIMPAMDYTYMSEDDVAAIISYLRTVTTRGTARPRTTFDLPARFAIADDDIEPIASLAPESPTSLDLGPRYDGGRYLARIACADCHGTDLAGSATAPDLTAVARYNRAQFFALLHAGRMSDGRVSPPMSRPRFHALYDYEIDALYDYLSARSRALTPVSDSQTDKRSGLIK